MKLEELLSEFEELSDWEEQCDYLIDLGFELPAFPEDQKTEENIVKGCQSRVWLVASLEQSAEPPRVVLQADSDAIIVKGLIAVVMAAYANQTPRQILETDIEGLFERMGLNRQLSSNRRNGLRGMVDRIRGFAALQVAAGS
ncbi:MAG: SufE family protein [Planctomyces sp.]|jgi:cysteine desulfuration protein SufE